MANQAKQNRKRKQSRGGVPTLLVIVLLIIALAMGGLGGFAIARHNAPVNDELEKANERIIELENTLNLIGFPMDEDPEDWVFDDSPEDENIADRLCHFIRSIIHFKSIRTNSRYIICLIYK